MMDKKSAKDLLVLNLRILALFAILFIIFVLPDLLFIFNFPFYGLEDPSNPFNEYRHIILPPVYVVEEGPCPPEIRCGTCSNIKFMRQNLVFLTVALYFTSCIIISGWDRFRNNEDKE